jgi:hypothetical protein
MGGRGDGADPAEDARQRLSIEERAARRDEINRSGRDRWAALVRSLQAGRELPVGKPARRRLRLSINPVFWTVLKIAAVGVAVYAIALGTQTWLREQSVDTWTGPSSAVTSGLNLAGCPEAAQIRDPILPSWIKVDGSVYLLTDRRRPFLAIGRTRGFTDSGYSSGGLHLLWIDDTPAGRARDDLLVWQERAIAGVTYAREPGCR